MYRTVNGRIQQCINNVCYIFKIIYNDNYDYRGRERRENSDWSFVCTYSELLISYHLHSSPMILRWPSSKKVAMKRPEWNGTSLRPYQRWFSWWNWMNKKGENSWKQKFLSPSSIWMSSDNFTFESNLILSRVFFVKRMWDIQTMTVMSCHEKALNHDYVTMSSNLRLDRWTKETFPEPDGTDLETWFEVMWRVWVQRCKGSNQRRIRTRSTCKLAFAGRWSHMITLKHRKHFENLFA